MQAKNVSQLRSFVASHRRDYVQPGELQEEGGILDQCAHNECAYTTKAIDRLRGSCP